MVNILDKILSTKVLEVNQAKSIKSIDEVKDEINQTSKPRDFIEAIKDKHQNSLPAVVAEIKKASPSKGVIRSNFNPDSIAKSYELGGAACISVLTDKEYFQGDPRFIEVVKNNCSLPVLRKDFIIDSYQVYESRALGADCILLIASALNIDELKKFESIANNLGMAVLVEVHNEEELQKAILLDTPLVGINNRNLKTFEVSLNTSIDLVTKIPNDKIPITESGIFKHSDIKLMNDNKIFTFLVGEAFMRDDNPGQSLKKLIS
ncbi:indole-3-glycerol phosphate synthase TrpC [Methylophilaceae bacterium]|nr:indole-3-glycerol phosphate synthase TrpC [Methylophilaceae bacterium]MDC1173723.1 indole-3-glycerol phosphate synthase TrpC [Methylophilaceae bacterium]